MASWSGWSSSIAVLFLSFLFFFVYRLRNRTGGAPVNWPVAGMLPTILVNFNRMHDMMTDSLTAAGRTFEFRGPWFMGMDFLLTCDPANLNHILASNHSNYPKGEDFNEIFEILGGGILNADAESWKIQRKMALNLMSSPSFRQSLEMCNRSKVYKVLIPILERAVQLGSTVDLQDVFTSLTFDTTSMLLTGVDPGCLAHDFPTVPFSTAVHDVEQALSLRHVMPRILWKLLRLLRIGPEKRLATAWEVMDNNINQIISCKREMKERDCNEDQQSITNHFDLVTSYMDLTMNDKLDGHFRSDKFLRDTILTFLTAGVDSTAVALTWFFWLVSTHPNVETKILEELVNVAMSSEEEMEFGDKVIEKLVYLHASVCETLRLFPPVPFNHKRAANDDVLPSGHVLRAGEAVLLSHYSAGRMEAIWGEDCLEFKPERWISESGGLRHVPSHKFIAFSSGPRSCLGKEMALTQTKAAAAAILYKFHVQVVGGHVVKPVFSVVLHAKNGLKVKLTKRRP